MTSEAESFAPKVRVLVEQEDRRDFVVAASDEPAAVFRFDDEATR